jgi:hypothetical protein
MSNDLNPIAAHHFGIATQTPVSNPVAPSHAAFIPAASTIEESNSVSRSETLNTIETNEDRAYDNLKKNESDEEGTTVHLQGGAEIKLSQGRKWFLLLIFSVAQVSFGPHQVIWLAVIDMVDEIVS